MPRSPKALIIACETYPKGKDIGLELKGTLKSAANFYGWLTDKTAKGLSPSDIYVCCDSELVAGHPADRSFASTREGVKTAINELVENEANFVSELFFYFAGHGVGFKSSPHLDLLLTTDYVTRRKSGDACIDILGLKENLERWLRGSFHYYFLDACRTPLKPGEFKPADFGLELDEATGELPKVCMLYSTRFGETAMVNEKFPTALLGGLRGDGRAKARVARSWLVKFGRLVQYVESQVDKPVDPSPSDAGEVLIAKLPGPFSTPLTVTVDDAAPGTSFVLNVRLDDIETPFPFQGPSFQRMLSPNDAGYEFDLLCNGKRLELASPVDEAKLDLYEPVELKYKLPGAGGGLESVHGPPLPESPPAPRAGRLAMLGLRGADSPSVDMKVFNAKGKNILSGSRAIEEGVAPGRYRVEVSEGGRLIHESEISLRRGVKTEADFFENKSRVRQSILGRVPSSDDGRVVDFSETLGPMATQNTALWLSVLGASRIVRDPKRYSKIGKFPLANFEDLKKDECAVYVLAGFEHANQAELSVSQTAKPKWEPMERVNGFKGVLHRRVKVKPGSTLISIALPDRPAVTFASFALPNRATLFVVTEDEAGKIDVRQMLLPVYTLKEFLPTVVTRRAGKDGEDGLKLVRYLVMQQDRFANRETLAPPKGQERLDLDQLLDGKWLDPLLGLTAILEMARRGVLDKNRRKLGVAVGNLEKYFGELPDVQAAKRILDPKQGVVPSSPPILRESLVRMPKMREKLPLPAGLLDHGSMWTSWVGAVKGPVSKKSK